MLLFVMATTARRWSHPMGPSAHCSVGATAVCLAVVALFCSGSCMFVELFPLRRSFVPPPPPWLFRIIHISTFLVKLPVSHEWGVWDKQKLVTRVCVRCRVRRDGEVGRAVSATHTRLHAAVARLVPRGVMPPGAIHGCKGDGMQHLLGAGRKRWIGRHPKTLT